MPKFQFNPEDLKRSLGIAKIIKPVTNDLVLKVSGGVLTIYSYDKRRSARAEVRPIGSDAPDGYSSDEYFLPVDRTAFLDSELASISISITEKGMMVKVEGDGQSRQASIKKRAELSKRAPLPQRFTASGVQVKAKHFEELVRQVSCSALVKETKTDDDMRVNQVHFYPDQSCAVANARFYATVAKLPGMALELSIVSADLPAMRTFCSKFGDGDIIVGQDKTKLYLQDPISNSSVTFSRIASTRPPLALLPEDGWETVVAIDRDQFAKNLSWCSNVIEGTQRLGVKALADSPDGSGFMELLNGKQEISRLPIKFRQGRELRADFPVKILASIVRYLGEGQASLKFAHPSSPTILEICEESQDGAVLARHFVQSMKERQ